MGQHVKPLNRLNPLTCPPGGHSFSLDETIHPSARPRGALIHDCRIRREGGPQDPGHRDAVMGVRQFRHALQGVRAARSAAQPAGEAGRRGARPPAHRRRPDRRPAHPVGQGRGLRWLRGPRHVRAGARTPARRDQLQRLPGRRLQAGFGHQPRPGHPPQGPRAPAGVRRHHGCDRLARPQTVVLRRHQLPRPGRHPGPSGPAGRGPGRGVRAAGREPADAAGVQTLRARLLRDRRPRLGHRVRALPEAWPQGAGRGGHRPPRARNQHRVHRRPAAARGGSARSTSTPGSTRTTT